MKWKSSNIRYLIGIGLPLAVCAALGVKAVNSLWWGGAIIVLALFLLWSLVKKVRCLPRPLTMYGELVASALRLPGEFGVELFTDEELCKHDFILRTVEFVSPLSFGNKPPKVVINPRLLEERGERFTQMAVMREIERYRRHHQVHTILHLVTPLLVAAIVALWITAFRIPLADRLGPFWAQFALPFLLTASFATHLFFWNKRVSKNDRELDIYLASVFPLEEVKQYIITAEEMEGGYQKSKHGKFTEHYASERLKQLEKD